MAQRADVISHKRIPLLLTLPIESVYGILDQLDPIDIFLSARDVCSRLNAITDTYRPYTVNTAITCRRLCGLSSDFVLPNGFSLPVTDS